MMKTLLRCLLFSAFSLSLSAQVIDLAFTARDGQTIHSKGVCIGDGRFVTVAVSTANISSIVDAAGTPQEVLAVDSATGLLIGKMSTESSSLPLGMGRDLAPATLLKSGSQTAAIGGWEQMHRSQVFPLALMRVNFSEKVPPPGSPLLGEDGKIVAFVHQPVLLENPTAFALPAEVARRMLTQIEKTGAASKVWIGILMQAGNSMPTIESVRPKSPAAKAGLMQEDIILSINNDPITTYAQAVDAFYYMTSGENIALTVLRGTEKKEIMLSPVVNPVQPTPRR